MGSMGVREERGRERETPIERLRGKGGERGRGGGGERREEEKGGRGRKEGGEGHTLMAIRTAGIPVSSETGPISPKTIVMTITKIR